jgi:3-oxoacyl-[acyl-carrier-protein] synthase II
MLKIAVTGIGVINSMGIGRESFWKSCRVARSGIRPITTFETRDFQSNVGGCVVGFKPGEFMAPMVYRRMSRISRITVAAGMEALADSRLDMSSVNKERVAVIMGTSYGSSSHVESFYLSLLKEGPRGAQPMLFPETVPNAPASHMAMICNINGPNITFCQNDISAEAAISYAVNLLSTDRVDVAIVGGSEELSEILFRCYDAVGALNRIRVQGQAPITPIPAGGLILGEGAAILIMERVGFARKRGARIYGTLDSMVFKGGDSAMGHYELNGKQMTAAMRRALAAAKIDRDAVDAISISANYSRELDIVEYEQLRRLFEGRGAGLRVMPLKYLTGDFGAAGTTRAAAVLLSLFYRQHLPSLPIAALMPQNDAPALWECVATNKIRHALMTSATFGGGNCSMVFSRYS